MLTDIFIPLLNLLASNSALSTGKLWRWDREGHEAIVHGLPHHNAQRRLQETCQSIEACAALAQQAVKPFARVFDDSELDRNASACKFSATTAAMRAVPSHDAVARANAYWESCHHGSGGRKWTRADARGYFNATWQPVVSVGGASCRSMSRFGPPLGRNGDGGKMVCEADKLLGSPGCLVVSVGLDDNTAFEEGLHRDWPQCEIVGMDGTLDATNKARVPDFIHFVPVNFDGKTHQQFVARQPVSLLKIDCDGCEYTKLPQWLDHVCTEQIIVEVHRQTFAAPRVNVGNIHRLMIYLHRAGYRVAFLEPNPRWPKLGTEYTLVRNASCPRQRGPR